MLSRSTRPNRLNRVASTPAPLNTPRTLCNVGANPYWTYLAGLNSAESRRSIQGHLDRLAAILLPAGTVRDKCAGELVPWGALRYVPARRPVGQNRPRHLSPRAIGLVVGRLRRAAHLGPLSTHDWRRTFVGDLLGSGARVSAAPVAVSPPAKHPHPPWTCRRRTSGRRDRRAEAAVLSQFCWPSLKSLGHAM